MPQLLVELFSEEIPARMQAAAARDLERMARERLTGAGLAFEGMVAHGGPRRLVLAAEQSNWPEAERYAHRLKGSVGNICADKLSKLAAESEQAARSKSDMLLKLTHETRQAIAECVGEIDVLLESMA